MMNAQTLIEITRKKIKEIEMQSNLGEFFTLYRQFIAVYELCDGDDEQIEDLKDIKKNLVEAYDEALDLIRTLDKIRRE